MNYEVRQFIRDSNLQPGDVIVAKKIGYRVLDHFIIYLGDDYQGHWFMANSMEEGVKQYDENEVFELVQTFEPVSIRRFLGDEKEMAIAIQRALSQEGKPYSLFGSNCEHFANYVQRGVKESPQVGFWLFTAVATIIVGISSAGRR